jgi:fatty-acyl-CoA synthase
VFASVAAAIQSHAESNGEKTAVHFGGEAISYAELWRRIVCATHRLKDLGVKAGDRVAYLGLNSPAELTLFIALSRLGAIFLPLNYRLAPAELASILAHADVTLLVCDDVHDDAFLKINTAVALIKRARAAMFFDLSALSAPTDVPAQDPSTPALLVYTSGTTGQPKGALHTHAGLVANCIISLDAHDLLATDHVLTVLPLFHVGGLCIQTLPALYAGATVTLHARFDAGAWLHDVARFKPTISLLVPATLRAVLSHPDFAATDLSSLKLINAGSSTIAESLIAPFHARGVPVCQVYGATETGPVSIYLKRAYAVARTGSAGQPGPGIDIRLVDERSQDVAAGDVGELLIRGSNVMQGYWQDPHNPAFADGWFHTGDLARVDADGYYWVVGRSKDMIISGGENIYPAEIENLLANCADIEECAVVGQPDARWGEVAVAVLVVKPGSTLTASAVMALFDGKLARFKQPKKIIFVDRLPKTAMGKVQKAQVVAHIAALASMA